VPGDPARLSCGKLCNAARLAEIKHNMGLDKPLIVQYGEYMKGIVAGREVSEGGDPRPCDAPCFGYSFTTHQPVWETIVDRVPATASLALGASVLFLVFGTGLGVMSALNKGKALDKAGIALALTGASVQIYFIGVIARAVFVDNLQWLPQPGYTPLTENPGKWFGSLILPWIALAAAFAAFYARMLRSNLIEAMSEDYIRTARAKGLPERRVVLGHGVRSAITPIVTVLGLDIGILLGGAILTESVFNVPGVGRLAYDAIQHADLPVIQGTVLFGAFFIIVANLVVDVMYAFLDPRVRYT
jgi:peptide/nickel transport system permease protein